MKAIQEILRDMREDKDLNQSDIAELIGTTQQQYSRYETGESELPLRVLYILTDYYGVSADYLMGRIDCMSGVPGLDKKVTPERTAGEVISAILSLDAADRTAVVEYITLLEIKECCTKQKENADQHI